MILHGSTLKNFILLKLSASVFQSLSFFKYKSNLLTSFVHVFYTIILKDRVPFISDLLTILYLFTGVCLGQQQFFRVLPTDVHVGEGRTAVINCAVENRAGRVQWTKDGLTLGKQS